MTQLANPQGNYHRGFVGTILEPELPGPGRSRNQISVSRTTYLSTSEWTTWFCLSPKTCCETVLFQVDERGQRSYVAGRIMEALREEQVDAVTGRYESRTRFRTTRDTSPEPLMERRLIDPKAEAELKYRTCFTYRKEPHQK